LENLYRTYDVYACVSLVSERTGKMETVLADFLNSIEKEPVAKRLEKSELALNENQELDFLVINYFNLLKSKFSYLENLPPPRVLYGTNTNKSFSDLPSTEAVSKSNFIFLF
jgi:hypothetical protein